MLRDVDIGIATRDRQMLLQILMLVAVLFAACWWGFAVYTYFRRDYFRA